MGVKCIDADKIGHQVYLKGQPAYSRIVGLFGDDVVAVDGEIDRRKIGPLVFADKSKMRALCDIVWPEMRVIIEREFQESRDRQEKIVVLEAAVLIESGFYELVDRVWVTRIDRRVAIERLAVRNNLSEADASARIDSQLTNEEREKVASVVFDTTGDFQITRDKVALEYQKLLDTLN
eukprot:gene18031-21524_t